MTATKSCGIISTTNYTDSKCTKVYKDPKTKKYVKEVTDYSKDPSNNKCVDLVAKKEDSKGIKSSKIFCTTKKIIENEFYDRKCTKLNKEESSFEVFGKCYKDEDGTYYSTKKVKR